jgi:hypothetical protein
MKKTTIKQLTKLFDSLTIKDLIASFAQAMLFLAGNPKLAKRRRLAAELTQDMLHYEILMRTTRKKR